MDVLSCLYSLYTTYVSDPSGSQKSMSDPLELIYHVAARNKPKFSERAANGKCS